MSGNSTIRDPLAGVILADHGSASRGIAGDIFQAWCASWNASTYANTIEVGNATFQDLPVLNPDNMDTGPVLVARAGSGSALVVLGPVVWRD